MDTQKEINYPEYIKTLARVYSAPVMVLSTILALPLLVLRVSNNIADMVAACIREGKTK